MTASRKSKEFHELKREAKSGSRKKKCRQEKMPAVQRLYETCKEVFAKGVPGIVPPSEDIERIRSVLDGMTEVDVGLSPNMPYFRGTTTGQLPIITYLPLFGSRRFSIGIFCLPPSGVIPLHNHPGMTVFSKLLFGKMHIKSYDWAVDVTSHNKVTVDDKSTNAVKPRDARLAKVKVDSDFTAPCKTSILYPADGGNMHWFTALTPCAVLDVLGPPYSDREGRHCTYYHEFPFPSFSADEVSVPEEERESHAWLQEREEPEDLTVVKAEYEGPQIVVRR